MKLRNGASLIELLVVIAISAIIVGLVAGLIQTLVHADRTAEEHLVRNATVRQLCDTVRKHVWAAAAANCEEQGKASWLKLQLNSGHRIEFLASEQQVTRTEYEDGHTRRREKYILPGQSRAWFEIVAGTNGKAVKLAIAHQNELASDPKVTELHVEAVIGRDLRFVSRRE
jgi:prepilin-type N-terminal cleavage/methylation domain-containing protein